MTYAFHPEAEAEFNHAIDYYEARETGLGYDFAIEVYDSIQNILRYPEAWNPLGDGIRSCLTNRFPLACASYSMCGATACSLQKDLMQIRAIAGSLLSRDGYERLRARLKLVLQGLLYRLRPSTIRTPEHSRYPVQRIFVRIVNPKSACHGIASYRI